MTKKTKELLARAIENNLEPVSFGLAPNPNGWSFEDHNEYDDMGLVERHEFILDIIKPIADEFDALTGSDLDDMRKAVFGKQRRKTNENKTRTRR